MIQTYFIRGKISTHFFTQQIMSCQILVIDLTGTSSTILNAVKNKFALFHKVRQRDNVPLVLPTQK